MRTYLILVKKLFVNWPIALIIAVFVILMSINLTGWLINTDEGTALYTVWRASLGEIPYLDFMTAQPPLFIYIGQLFFSIFGSSIVALRSVAITISALTVFLFYLFARLLYRKNIAVLATLLFAINPDFFTHGRTFRSDTFMILFLTIGFGLFALAVQKEKKSLLIAASLVYALAILTKFFAVLGWIGCILFLLTKVIRKPTYRTISDLLVLILPTIIIVSPLLAFYYITTPYMGENLLGLHIKHGVNLSLMTVLLKGVLLFAEYIKGNFVLILLVPAIWRMLKSHNDLDLVVIWQIATASVFLLMSRALYTRHLLYLLPAVSLLCALEIGYILESVSQNLPRHWFTDRLHSNSPAKIMLQLFILTLLISLIFLPGVMNVYQQISLAETDTLQIGRHIAQMTKPDDVILSDYALLSFHAQRPSIPQAGIISHTTAQTGHITADDLIEEIETKRVKLILLQLEPPLEGHFVFMPDYNVYLTYVINNFTLVETVQLDYHKFAIYEFIEK